MRAMALIAIVIGLFALKSEERVHEQWMRSIDIQQAIPSKDGYYIRSVYDGKIVETWYDAKGKAIAQYSKTEKHYVWQTGGVVAEIPLEGQTPTQATILDQILVRKEK